MQAAVLLKNVFEVPRGMLPVAILTTWMRPSNGFPFSIERNIRAMLTFLGIIQS